MVQRELSVIIAARNEDFLQNTIDDVLKNSEADTEVIVILDGYWPDKGIPTNEKVNVIHYEESIGQRAAVNVGARLSQAEYIMKLDAHCSMGKGFDKILMENCKYDWTVIPRQHNLHVFNWVCKKCGTKRYQGPKNKKCPDCDNTTEFEREMVWKPRKGTGQNFYRFDSNMKFQYWRNRKQVPGTNDGDLVETMSFIGACFFMHRERYWELGGLDEAHGSYGQLGTEVACKTWLSGGRLLTNKKTSYAHAFRTQGQDWGFPYPISGRQVQRARDYSNDLWKNNKWPKAKHPLSWLIEKFDPPDWDIQKPKASKGLVYYTDNRLEERLAKIVRQNLISISNGHPIVSVSHYPIDFGHNIVLNLERSTLSMCKQILEGLKTLDTEYVSLTEHDLLYHPSHFDFIPEKDDTYYYNTNVWQVDSKTGKALYYACRSQSGLCANRELLIEHYTKKVEKIEKEGFTRRLGFEPGKSIRHGGIDDHPIKHWQSKYPNIDLCHDNNFTWRRWDKKHFRRKPKEWIESDEVPGWGKTKDRMNDFLRGIL